MYVQRHKFTKKGNKHPPYKKKNANTGQNTHNLSTRVYKIVTNCEWQATYLSAFHKMYIFVKTIGIWSTKC